MTALACGGSACPKKVPLDKNTNALILGTPGSGKSFAAKWEIVNVFLITDDDIIIADPESEYAPLVSRLKGQIIRLSPASPHRINPMDINLNYAEDDDPIALKSDFILSLCELVAGGKDYHSKRKFMREVLTAEQNAKTMLGPRYVEHTRSRDRNGR